MSWNRPITKYVKSHIVDMYPNLENMFKRDVLTWTIDLTRIVGNLTPTIWASIFGLTFIAAALTEFLRTHDALKQSPEYLSIKVAVMQLLSGAESANPMWQPTLNAILSEYLGDEASYSRPSLRFGAYMR